MSTATSQRTVGPIRTVEQVECPSCDARLRPTEYVRKHDTHPRLHTERMSIHTDCPHCGSRYSGVYYLSGGVWTLESLAPTPARSKPVERHHGDAQRQSA
jgi:primosomal protein N'